MQKINFEQTIKLIHKEINVKLVKANKELDRFLVSAVPIIPKLGNYFFKKRGKQLRPVICLLSSKMINKNYSQISSDIDMSAAIEFIHGATLLHDDVIDEGKLRRGQKSINTIWNNKFSVLFGDFLFSKSFQLMTKANSLKAMASLSQVSSKISEGEFLQLTHENNIHITERKYIEIISLKTAELFAASMKIPAILTGKNLTIISSLNKLGLYFGIIFQIMDDYLDYFGDRVTGKKNGKDFYEGKITLPIILLLLPGVAKVLPNSLKITFAMSFVVVFPFEPVIPIVFPLNLFLLNLAKFINAVCVFFTNNPLYFRALSLRDTITPEAPFCIAFSKKS